MTVISGLQTFNLYRVTWATYKCKNSQINAHLPDKAGKIFEHKQTSPEEGLLGCECWESVAPWNAGGISMEGCRTWAYANTNMVPRWDPILPVQKDSEELT